MRGNGNKPRKDEAQEAAFIEKVKTIKISRQAVLQAAAAGETAIESAVGGCARGEAASETVPTTAATSLDGIPACARIPTSAGALTSAPIEAAGASRPMPSGNLIFLSSANYLGTWNPYGHTLQSHVRMQFNCVESLLWMNPQGYRLEGLLAESWEQLDRKTVEVRLRRGIKFHNGQEFTGEDVKASLEYTSDPKQIWSFLIGAKLGVDVVDPYKVRIMTEKPNATLVTSGLAVTPICSKEDVADPSRWEKGLNGTGPFKWVRYAGEETGIEMTANMEYRDGPPRIKDLVFRFVADPYARLAALKNGTASVIERIEPEEIEVIKADPNLDVLVRPANEYIVLWFRMQKEPLKSNKKLRQAIAHAIDRDAIVKNVLQGVGYPVDGFLYKDTLHYSSAQNYPQYDPEEARGLLAEAGYPKGEGLRELEYLTSVGFYMKRREYGEAIVDMLRNVGIRVKLSPLESASWMAVYEEHRAGDMTDCGWFSPAFEQDVHIVPQFYSPGIVSGDVNPKIDAAIDEERGEADPEKRVEKLARLNERLADHLPGVALFQTAITIGMSKKVKGFVQLATGGFPLRDVLVES